MDSWLIVLIAKRSNMIEFESRDDGNIYKNEYKIEKSGKENKVSEKKVGIIQRMIWKVMNSHTD